MPWETTCTMDQRVQFIAAIRAGDRTMAELCRAFGICRRVGYKWLSRYEADGPGGLAERSSKPLSSPQGTSPEILRLVLGAREKRPHWGPKKIVASLSEQYPDLVLPAPSTCGALLKRVGLVRPRRRREANQAKAGPAAQATYGAPNETWCADFKGDFKTGDGFKCYPLTISDGHSRFLFAVHGLYSTAFETVWPVFERMFREYGLPWAIRTDNGPPFASRGIHGLSQLSVRLLKLGIWPDRIDPGHPEQNGRHERMHRTLKAETAKPPARNLRLQQAAFDAFRDVYNRERPHEALGQLPPSRVYTASPRPYPRRLEDQEYQNGVRIHRVTSVGQIYWRNGDLVNVGRALAGELVGLDQTEDGTWRVLFGEHQIGVVDERVGNVLVLTPLQRPARRQDQKTPAGGPSAPRS